MTLEERAHLILAFAKVLYTNGQTTGQIWAVTERLGRALNLPVKLLPPRWGELQLIVEDDQRGQLLFVTDAEPVSTNMQRVVPAMKAVDALIKGDLTPSHAAKLIDSIAQEPPLPAWIFSLGAALGAVALSLLFGLRHFPSLVIIFLSAACGGLLRRLIAKYSTNVFLQPFFASLLAGMIGALAARGGFSFASQLVAICPCMILVPGPHLLNSGLDMIHGWLHLGATRMMYALLILLAISLGLMIGLACFHVYLPLELQATPRLPFWQDILAAGVAIGAFSIFYSTHFSLLAWPLCIGMLAHTLRWIMMSMFGASIIMGDLYACVLVSVIMTIVARRREMPFAAVSFVAVVSMMPGIFIFQMASGLIQLTDWSHTTLALISVTIANSIMALMITLTMCMGLLIPKLFIDYLIEKKIKVIEKIASPASS